MFFLLFFWLPHSLFFSLPTMTEESIKPFPELVVDINSSIPEIQLKAVSQLGKLLTQKVGNSLGDVIESGVLPTLVSFLGSDKEEALQKEATWALTSITSGGSSETNALVEAGALPLLVNLLSSKNEDIQDNVVVVLGNIAGDSVRLRDLVLESGVVLPLCNCGSNCHKVVTLRHMTWALSNLCRGTPPPALALVLPAIPILDLLLGLCPDDEILSDACWALAHISEGTNERIDAVLNERSIVPRLVELLDHVSPSVVTPSLRAIGNIVTGQLYQTQVVLDCPLALPFLKKLTHNPIKSVRKEACWAISNITAGSQEQIQMVIDAEVIPAVVAMLISNEEDEGIKKEVVWVLGNIFSCGSVDQIVYLVEQNVIPGFLSYLDYHDSSTVVTCLDGIERVLQIGQDSNRFGKENPFVAKIEESDDFYKLRELEDHINPLIDVKAQSIVQLYFEEAGSRIKG